MRFVLIVVFLFCELVGLMLVAVGLSSLDELRDVIAAILAGRPWEPSRLGGRIIAVTVPLCLGGLLTIGLAWAFRTFWKMSRREERYPDQPWLWREDWAEQRGRISKRVIVNGTVLALLGYGLVIVPGGMMIANENSKTFIVLFVCAIGFFLYAFIKKAWSSRRWWQSELRIDTLPGVVGGPFAGLVTLSEYFPPGTPFRVTLECQTMSGSSSRGGASTSTLWQAQHVIDRFADIGRMDAIGLPVYFAIPYDLPPTSQAPFSWKLAKNQRGRRRSITWWLKVEPKDGPGDREIKFQVPVFKTAQSSPEFQPDESKLEAFLEPVDAAAILARVPNASEPLPNGRRLRFSTYRPPIAIGIGVLGLLCAGGVAAALYWLASPLSYFAALIPGALFVACAMGLYEMLFWSATIDILHDRIDVEAGYRGFKMLFTAPRDRPPPLGTALEFNKSNGAWWCVRMEGVGAKPTTIIKRLDGPREAEAMRDWLAAQIAGERRGN